MPKTAKNSTAEARILEIAATQGTRRLIRGLFSRGVTIYPATNYYIGRDRGQPMMNKAAGELAPTWRLARDGLWARRPGWHDDGCADRTKPMARWNEKEYREITSHIPLGWILKTDPARWDMRPSDDYGDDTLVIETPDLPPHWR